MMRISNAGALAVLLLAALPARAATPAFVGCPADGQLGKLTAPAGRAPDLPIADDAARRLAWYAGTKTNAVLGPAGWHCFELYGANGWMLVVTPAANDMASLAHGIAGPAIQLTARDGGTSGRFEVASIASGLFPDAAEFVRKVAAENQAPPQFFASKVATTDLVERRGPDVVLFETPAGRTGIGTESRLLPAPSPIEGAVLLLPRQDMSLMHLAVRLPPAQDDLAPIITGDIVARYAVAQAGSR